MRRRAAGQLDAGVAGGRRGRDRRGCVAAGGIGRLSARSGAGREQPDVVRKHERETAREALPVDPARGELLDGVDPLLLDLAEVPVRGELGGAGVRDRRLGLGLGDLAPARVDAIDREDVDERHHEDGAEDAEDHVGAALLAAGRRPRAVLDGEEVDGVHAAPSARPVATVWR